MNFLLVCVIDRDITVTKHYSYMFAFDRLKREISAVMGISLEEVENIIEHQYGDGPGFHIDKYSAWATPDDGCGGERECDWAIYDLSHIPPV